MQLRKAAWDAVIDLDDQSLDNMKKLAEAAQKMLADKDKQLADLQTECDKLEDSIRKTITDYQKQAIKANNDKLESDLGKCINSF